MRLFVITLLLLIFCPLMGTGFADEKSDCINNCANDRRSNDMYCPPAGGFTDEDHKQCIERNASGYNSCIMTCSPSAPPPADQQLTPAQLPAKTSDDSAPKDKSEQPGY